MSRQDSFHRFKNVTLIKGNTVSLQKFNIFTLKRLSAVMRRLIVDIIGDRPDVKGNQKTYRSLLAKRIDIRSIAAR